MNDLVIPDDGVIGGLTGLAHADTGSELARERVRRAQLFRTMAWSTVISALIFVGIFVLVLGALVPDFPRWPLIFAIAVFISLVLGGLWQSRRGRLEAAITVFMISLISVVFVFAYYMGGVFGSLPIVIAAIPVVAGLLGGGSSARWMAVIITVLFLVMALLESLGILQPFEFPEATSRWLHIGVFLATLASTTVIVFTFSNLMRRALLTAQQRGEALAAMSRQAEQAAQSEREAREREARSAVHLRETVSAYARYLERISAGDYEVQLNVGELHPDVEGDTDLHALGDYLNSTVDTLVATLSRMQDVQQRYTAQSWQRFRQLGAVGQGVRYDGHQLESAPDAWLPQMTAAVDEGKAVVGEDGVAVPIVVNQQVIGVIGGQRPGGTPWSQEDLDLIADATGQLAQTIESLRLLDETQRSAIRDQTVGEVTAHMRESLDVDAILQTAAREIEQSLNLYDVTIRLSPENVTD